MKISRKREGDDVNITMSHQEFEYMIAAMNAAAGYAYAINAGKITAFGHTAEEREYFKFEAQKYIDWHGALYPLISYGSESYLRRGKSIKVDVPVTNSWTIVRGE